MYFQQLVSYLISSVDSTLLDSWLSPLLVICSVTFCMNTEGHSHVLHIILIAISFLLLILCTQYQSLLFSSVPPHTNLQLPHSHSVHVNAGNSVL
jgi:hypothetical protein